MQKNYLNHSSYDLEEILRMIEKYYLSTRSHGEIFPNLFNHPSLSSLSLNIQEKILSCTVNNLIALKYPPSSNYKRFFLRYLVNEVEKRKCEPSENLLLAYTDEIKEPNQSKQFHYCTYKIKDKFFTIQENPCMVTLGTTGLKTWEASIFLSEWCVKNSVLLKNRRILELGSGAGLLGCVVLHFCQPSHYVFTDKSPHVRSLVETNILLNQPTADTENGDIRKPEDLYEICNFDFCKATVYDVRKFYPDIILGADIVFDPDCLPDLVQTLKVFLTHGTAIAYITCAIRNQHTDLQFQSKLDSNNFTYTIQEYEGMDFPCDDVYHYKLYTLFPTKKDKHPKIIDT